MNIWVTRHGQTDLNKARLMQGRTDAPLNETGRKQAESRRRLLLERHPGLVFDAVYSSPLIRAVVTASVIGGVPEEEVLTDSRLIETDFGRYEKRKYYLLGPGMTLYWACPELFPAPPGVETTSAMIERARSFLDELKSMPYENVLLTCHGGILRVLTGLLTDNPRGYQWRPKARNCEIRVVGSDSGKHRRIETLV